MCPSVGSFGARAVDLAQRAGLVADDWQRDAVTAFLAHDEQERFVHFECGLDVARQNGKDGAIEIIELDALFNWPGENLIIHSAHEFATAQEHQLRLEALIQNTPELHRQVRDKGGYKHANGQESINLKSGTRIIFKARTKGGARGFTGALLVWNEAMALPVHVVGAMMPTLRASTSPYGPMIIYAGSAVDQEIHDHGVVFARVRERGIAQEPGVAWIEFSAPYGHPSEMDEASMLDVLNQRAANPALGIRIDPAHMAREIAAMPSRQAAVELFGVGDWPRTDGQADSVISIEDWDARTDLKSQLQQPYSLAFDVSPERRTSIGLAGRNQDGRFHVEVQESRPGTSWVVARIAEMVERGSPEAVVCDATGPASSLLVDLKDAGVDVETVSATEHGQACGRLVDMVNDETIRHLGSTELRDAIRGARTRPLGDAWLWSRKSSSVDISPLVASTLALWAVSAAAPKYAPAGSWVAA